MRSWLWSTVFFLLGYAIATVVGFGLFYLSETAMWIGTMTLMPIVFACLFYIYLRTVKCPLEASFRESAVMVIYWITLSFSLDAIVYILIVPAVYGGRSNWLFFMDQSPWIWLNYIILLLVGAVGRWAYHRYRTTHVNS
jgi:hypothetical protein